MSRKLNRRRRKERKMILREWKREQARAATRQPSPEPDIIGPGIRVRWVTRGRLRNPRRSPRIVGCEIIDPLPAPPQEDQP